MTSRFWYAARFAARFVSITLLVLFAIALVPPYERERPIPLDGDLANQALQARTRTDGNALTEDR